jgi:hypothetical protein
MIIDSEDVKQAIVERLLEIFPSANVYKETKTKILYPHFFVYQINVSDEEERKNYHLLHYQMEVRYRVASDPSTDLKLEQNLDNVGLKLLTSFNIINFENEKVRCKDKTTEKVDGVLHFMFNITTMVKDVVAKNKAKQMSLTSSVNLTEE